MCSLCCLRARPQTLQVLCVQICMFYSSICLVSWPLCAETAKVRCGSDLLSDLMFVCGDRGIYLRKGLWSGYGARSRGKGIVDLCCLSSGCELHHLEMYCAKPRSQQTTYSPSTTVHATTQPDLFQEVFQKKLLQYLGPPSSPKREAYRRNWQHSLRHKVKASRSHRRMTAYETTSQPTAANKSAL
ncbi:insulin-like growth factor I [Neolamprologus brichardi]|uniref:insulin-like growth factor I n=1 Tax=Neolamprologus brichardi TaxID=32507 RepID=UPI0016436BB1|nr:insulin-like growth factor I [Neolamprologus brichardi]